MKQRFLYIIVLLMASGLSLRAQDSGKPGAVQDTVFTIPDYNAELPSGADILKQDIDVKPVKKYHSSHMIGVRYGVNFSTAQFSPDVIPGYVWRYNNYGIVYTYYNDLWDMLDNFGTQVIAHLNREGFTAEYFEDINYTVGQLDLMANFRFNPKPFRFFINAGPYAGYRIDNNREGEQKWKYTDNRFDYGLIFGGGAGIMFGPFEFHLEANYKWGLSSYYHTYVYSDEYWLFAYPRIFMFSGTLYFKFK